MKLKARLTDTDHEISLELRDRIASAQVDERKYRLEVRELSDGHYLLIDGHSVYDCIVSNRQGERDHVEVSLRGVNHVLTLTDPKRLRSSPGGVDHDKGTAQIVAPMPGKVVRVLVEVGAQVEAGDGIVVVEAMKMQNEMKAPRAGVVASISVEAGATVNAGDKLALIE